MSQSEIAVGPAPTSAWHMYRAMVGVGVVCGLLIVSVYQVTLPVIEQNKAEALQAAILHVLPEARVSTTFRLDEAGGFQALDGESQGAARIYAGYDENDKLVGLAVEAQGMGYQDVIRLIYGYSYADDAIIGVQVLESKETPGLGDRIETDPGFLQNFEQLDVSLLDDRSNLANPIVAVSHGKKTHPWEIDGITGATISSKAIADLLNRSAERWVPQIESNLEDFEGGN